MKKRFAIDRNENNKISGAKKSSVTNNKFFQMKMKLITIILIIAMNVQ